MLSSMNDSLNLHQTYAIVLGVKRGFARALRVMHDS